MILLNKKAQKLVRVPDLPDQTGVSRIQRFSPDSRTVIERELISPVLDKVFCNKLEILRNKKKFQIYFIFRPMLNTYRAYQNTCI